MQRREILPAGVLSRGIRQALLLFAPVLFALVLINIAGPAGTAVARELAELDPQTRAKLACPKCDKFVVARDRSNGVEVFTSPPAALDENAEIIGSDGAENSDETVARDLSNPSQEGTQTQVASLDINAANTNNAPAEPRKPIDAIPVDARVVYDLGQRFIDADQQVWMKILWEETEGWVLADQLEILLSPLVPGSNLDRGAEVDGTHEVRTKSKGRLNVRRAPGRKSAVITKISHRSSVRELGKRKRVGGREWIRVAYGGGAGWVEGSALKRTKFFGDGTSNDVASKPDAKKPSRPSRSLGTLYVNSSPYDTLNLRSSPSAKAKILARLEDGLKVSKLSKSGKWTQLRVAGYTGWASSSYLSSSRPSKKKNTTTQRARTTPQKSKPKKTTTKKKAVTKAPKKKTPTKKTPTKKTPKKKKQAAKKPAKKTSSGLRVSGLAAGQALNLMAGPGQNFPAVSHLPHNATGVRSQSGVRNGFRLVSWKGRRGWAFAGYLR